MEMSTLTEVGVMDVKSAACDMLLEHRLETKMAKGKATDILHRLHVATPAPRDDKKREPFIPAAAAARRKVKQPVKLKGRGMVTEADLPYDGPRRRTARDLEIELREEYATSFSACERRGDCDWCLFHVSPAATSLIGSLHNRCKLVYPSR